MPQLTVLYRDEFLVVIHKPAGMLMHRSPISRDSVFVLQTLRNQIGQRVYPVHRLDRATSGVVVFGLSPEIASAIAQQFENHLVEKEYLAIARGWVDDCGIVDYPVSDEEGSNISQQAVTEYRCLHRVELPFAVDRYPNSRYSCVSVVPHTGRRQQIRKHFKHISHHLIGDTTHGNGKHNRFFRERYDVFRLMLTAKKLCFLHPVHQQRLCFHSESEAEWDRLFREFGWLQS